MERLFWCSLLLNFLKVTVTEGTGKAEDCVPWSNKVIWKKTGESVTLSCTDRSDCLGQDWHYEWFIFKENTHARLTLQENHKYKLEGASLYIPSLLANDSGIYHCAAASWGNTAQGSQYVGLGTTLVVRETVMLRHILLWFSFVLLVIYSVALVTLIVKKYGCRRIHKIDEFNRSKKTEFRDVLQEMRNRKKLGKGKRTVSRDSSQAGTSGADLNGSTDDIYQNV